MPQQLLTVNVFRANMQCWERVAGSRVRVESRVKKQLRDIDL